MLGHDIEDVPRTKEMSDRTFETKNLGEAKNFIDNEVDVVT